MKAVRRLLEKDLGLPKKALDKHKQDIADLVDKVCLSCSAHSSNHMSMLAYCLRKLAEHTAVGKMQHTVQSSRQPCSALPIWLLTACMHPALSCL